MRKTLDEMESEFTYHLIAVANAKLNKMKQAEMREFIVGVLISEYRNDSDFLKQDAEIYLKESI